MGEDGRQRHLDYWQSETRVGMVAPGKHRPNEVARITGVPNRRNTVHGLRGRKKFPTYYEMAYLSGVKQIRK